jgi:hypothetical protein
MMTSIMLNATQARAKAQNDLVIFNEVRTIELAILTAVAAGNYQIETTNSAMTDTGTGRSTATAYYNAWQGITSDRSKDVQMLSVIKYFSDLGYNIERRTNAATGDTFKWLIYW